MAQACNWQSKMSTDFTNWKQIEVNETWSTKAHCILVNVFNLMKEPCSICFVWRQYCLPVLRPQFESMYWRFMFSCFKCCIILFKNLADSQQLQVYDIYILILNIKLHVNRINPRLPLSIHENRSIAMIYRRIFCLFVFYFYSSAEEGGCYPWFL